MTAKFAVLAAAAAIAGSVAVRSAGAQGEHVWVEAPTVADIAAAYPARARAAGVGGQVELTCEMARDGHPRDCAALKETPGGYGFGAAAVKLATRLKVSDQGLTNQNIFIPVSFDAAVLKGEATVTKPAWAAIPSAQDFQATFPKTENGVNHVRVVLGCTVQAGGVLGGCAVAQEDPPGQGYGDGALALASKFRVGPWSQDGAPTVGAHIRLPIRYELTAVKQ
jgi:TonB family protein